MIPIRIDLLTRHRTKNVPIDCNQFTETENAQNKVIWTLLSQTVSTHTMKSKLPLFSYGFQQGGIMSEMRYGILAGIALFGLTGCGGTAGNLGLGALGGAAAGAGGYEYHLKTQKDRVKQDYKDGKIDEKERDIRLNQIERDSLLQ